MLPRVQGGTQRETRGLGLGRREGFLEDAVGDQLEGGAMRPLPYACDEGHREGPLGARVVGLLL